jgi:asparagine synthase (glutamine-hydrolysing)
MCGIAGILSRNHAPLDDALLRAMTAAVAHRGPDGDGFYVDGAVGFGHRRLAIIDLTDDGRQPMSYLDGRLVITYNGEVYNYVELREELERAGYVFRSHSDTEVMLAAYARWGPDCVTRFNGMWGFAIHDRARNVVFCARDRFGVKPFYYVETPEHFAFGSEIRQLLPFLPRVAADRSSLVDFIMTNAADHSPATFYAGVKKLPAGHTLTYDLSTARHEIRRFYSIRMREDVARLEREEAVEQFRALLTDAIKLRLRSDVTVGTCLSGGLDSSSVATVAAGLYTPASGQPFSAITAVSEEERTNEARYAEVVANHSGMAWLTTRPTYDDFVESLPEVVRAQEEPFGSTSLTMQYFVMKTARANGVTVLLDGQGGDETLLGYEKYYASYIVTALRRHGIGAALAAMQETQKNNANMGPLNIAKYLIGGTVAPARWLFYCRRHDYLRDTPPMPERIREFAHACWDEFALQELEIRSTNLPLLLRYEDKNSMAHSIETRLPFLDWRLLETSLSLPGEYKIREGWSKWVLRQAMAGRIPDEIAWRKNKLGFESPESLWLERHRPAMRPAVLGSRLLAELCDMGRLGQKYEDLEVRTRWRLYSVALWEQAFGVQAVA